MADETDQKPGGMSRKLRVLLVISLALNLLVIGTVGGAMLARSKWEGHRPARLDFAGGPLTRALDPVDRRAIGRQMRRAYRDGGTTHAALRAEFDGLIADLTATPFDAEAVGARLARQGDLFEERLELGQRLLLQRLTEMDTAERAAYADRLREVLRHRRSSQRRHD